MLPSKGFFTNIRCIFNDAGACERPYCHYRHTKRGTLQNENRESAEQALKSIQVRFNVSIDNGDSIIERVVGQLDHEPSLLDEFGTTSEYQVEPSKATYSPTPINILLKSKNEQPLRRHIPIQYTPNRPPVRNLKTPKIEYVPTLKTTKNGSSESSSYVPVPLDKIEIEETTYVPTVNQVPQYQHYVPSPTQSDVSYNPSDINTINETPQKYSPPQSQNQSDQTYEPSVKINDELTTFTDDFDFINDILNEVKKEESPPVIKEESPPVIKEPSPKKESSRSSSKHSRSSSKHKSKSHKSSHSDRKSKESKKHDSKKHESKKHDSKKHDSKSKSSSDSKSKSRDSKSSRSGESRSSKVKENSSSKRKESSKSSKEKKTKTVETNDSKERKPTEVKEAKPIEIKQINSPENKPVFFSPIDADVFSSGEEDIEEQCRRIFEDSTNVLPAQPKCEKRPLETPEECEVTRKRVAHVNPSNNIPKPKSIARPNFKAESSKMLLERYKLNAASKVVRPCNSKLIEAVTSPVPSKVRIAHVPNVNKLLTAKVQVPQNKGSQIIRARERLLNKSSQEILTDRPTCKDPENTKIPYHMRASILNNMIDACLDMYVFPDAAYERAKNEEYTVFDKCRSLAVYKSSAKLAVHRLQVQAKQGVVLDESGPSNSGQSKSGSKSSLLYTQLQKYVLSEEELWENGYPKSHPDTSLHGAAIINSPHKPVQSKQIDEKICCRCHKIYKIDECGFQLHPEECIYHYRRRYRYRGESKYGCCSSTDEYGCTSATCHVSDEVDTDNLRGYVKTIDVSDINDNEDYGIFALDCEMSYTTAGIELTRITVIDRNCETVYETIVRPFHPIIDYNTRFSGIDESQMNGVTTTLLHVQANLLHMFNSKTILIGHSLESDFKALKLIHHCVIDTSVMFPHKMGLPFKKALKTLAYDYLKKIIQNQVEGHDSAEDAITCMELVLWKVKEDAK